MHLVSLASLPPLGLILASVLYASDISTWQGPSSSSAIIRNWVKTERLMKGTRQADPCYFPKRLDGNLVPASHGAPSNAHRILLRGECAPTGACHSAVSFCGDKGLDDSVPRDERRKDNYAIHTHSQSTTCNYARQAGLDDRADGCERAGLSV